LTQENPVNSQILDGKLVAEALYVQMGQDVAGFTAKSGITPCLAAVLVGDDPASHVYVRNKERACHKVGMQSQLIRLPATTTTMQLLETLDRLNNDAKIHGILVQLPLPDQIDARRVLDHVLPSKDVDAFSPENVGLISQGRPRFLPCTPHGVVQIMAKYNIRCAGKEVVVVGRSDIVGKPLAMMLVQKDGPCGPDYCNATVTCCHSRSENIKQITLRADILIVAIGRPQAITADMIKPGAVVIDVGINRVGDRLVGDVDYEAATQVASAVTPVPGGIGPLTVAMLMRNTLEAARVQHSAAAGT
jgi:methylenetetrahydrofolate dehydrogenase (NADP+) / methenyltetrahydrofolate cyclohydrolase